MDKETTKALLNGMAALIEKMEKQGLPMTKANIMGNWVLLGDTILDELEKEVEGEE